MLVHLTTYPPTIWTFTAANHLQGGGGRQDGEGEGGQDDGASGRERGQEGSRRQDEEGEGNSKHALTACGASHDINDLQLNDCANCFKGQASLHGLYCAGTAGMSPWFGRCARSECQWQWRTY